MDDPRAIYQSNLDEVAVRLWARDFEGVCDRLLLYQTIRTEDGTTRIDNTAGVMRELLTYRQALDDLGAEGYHRLCLDARYASDARDEIAGNHRTFVLRGGERIIAPYDCEMSLILTKEGWKAADLRVLTEDAGIPVIDPAEFRGADEARGGEP